MLTLTDVQQCSLSITPEDAKGNPGQILGVPTWASSDATVATVAADASGLTATVVAVGKLGTAQINVTAVPLKPDGTGDTPITGTLDVTVTGSEASQLVVATGTPTLQVPPPPPPPPPPAA